MNKVLARGIMTIAAVNDGKDGQTPHLHIAYANSPDGKVDFSTDDSKDRAYIGQYVSYTDEPDSTDAGMYIWSRFKGNDAVVWHVSFSIRNITGKQGETFKLKYGRTVGESTSWYDDNPIFHGFKQLYAVIIDGATGKEKMFSWEMDMNVADFFTGGSMTVRLMNSYAREILAQDTIYPEAKPGKDAVSYKLLPLSEKVLAYISEDKETKKKTNKVDLKLEYKIQKTVGEQVSFTTLGIEGMTLTIQPSVGDGVAFTYKSDMYRLEVSGMKYKEIPDNSYTVTLKKGGDIVDQRIVAITFKPKVVFDIDTVNGSLTSEIKTVEGQMSKIEQTAKHIRLTVDGGTRPNLLWGSDLNLDGVDVTDKAAIQKHLGVELAEIGFSEWFEYLKGGGVAGADAIHIKNVYKSNEWIKWTNVAWKAIALKPHTKYTISVWVKFKSYGKTGCFYVDCSSDDNRYNFGGYLYSDGNYTRSDIDKWKRMCYVFDSGDSSQMKHLFFACLADEREGAQCELWLSRPKLEESDEATPWCAYDGTVEALLATGLDIKNRKMIATTDNFVVQNNKGERTVMVDENGKLNTNLIDATEIYGMKIAQPFEAYASKKEMKNGKSLSWVLENWSQDYGFFGGGVRMNGVTSNIFNNTGGTVSLWLPLITPFKFCQVDIPNNVMLRAVAIYRTQWDGCRWYLLCPWEDNGSGGVRLKAFNG